MLRIKKHGQSTVEYTTIIIIVMAALLAAGVYFKRGMQGKWKETLDQLGDQYDPLAANTSILHRMTSSTLTVLTTTEEGNMIWSARTDSVNSSEQKTGTMTLGSYW